MESSHRFSVVFIGSLRFSMVLIAWFLVVPTGSSSSGSYRFSMVLVGS